ncbi:UNVERIFIED_CONTAM: hypothetical protein K2H54_034675 [Gekko kuhli]
MNTEQGGLVEKVFNLSFLKCIFQKEELLLHENGWGFLPESVSVSIKSMNINIYGIQVNIWRASMYPKSEMCESAPLMLQKPGEKHERPRSSIRAYTKCSCHIYTETFFPSPKSSLVAGDWVR